MHVFLDSIEIPRFRDTKRPIRIAVLDTGVNMNNPFVFLHRSRIKSKSFLSDLSTHDTDGHGTHVDVLTLKVARNALIHVARVAPNHEDLDDKAIADVSIRLF